MDAMRRIILAVALVVAGSSLGFAQSASVTIQNEESTTFYYTVDPPDLAQLTTGSPLAATKVAEFFAAQATEPQFAALAPGAQASLQGLTDGSHLLVGFFATQDQDTFPVRLITLQADSRMGDRFYSIYGSPAIVDAARGVGRLAQFARSSSSEQPPVEAQVTPPPAQVTPPPAQVTPAPAQVTPAPAQEAPPQQSAQEQAQTQAPPAAAATSPVVSFSPSYNPVFFTKESRGDFSVQPIAGSRAWTLLDMHISAFSARIDDGVLTLTLTSEGDFSPDVSYFLYVFATRAPGTPSVFTLELRPRALPDRGACILWQNGSAAPALFGSVRVEGRTAIVEAKLADEPAAVQQALGSAGSFDLTSCWYDKPDGVYEEFYFATVAMADIPVTR